MTETVDHATVQYGDFRGSAALDSHGGGEVHAMAKAYGVPERYFPVGLSWYAEPLGIASDGKVRLTIYAVDTSIHGHSADDIVNSLRGNPRIPVKAFPVEIPGIELRKYIKRLNVVLKSRLFGPEAVFEVEED